MLMAKGVDGDMLGTRIAALRQQAGMSQASLARVLGTSASAVGMYEQGRREPSAELLVKLGEIFDVSVDFLLTGNPRQERDQDSFTRALLATLEQTDRHLDRRRDRPFSRQELAVLMAAMLMEP